MSIVLEMKHSVFPVFRGTLNSMEIVNLVHKIVCNVISRAQLNVTQGVV